MAEKHGVVRDPQVRGRGRDEKLKVGRRVVTGVVFVGKVN